MKKNLSQLLVAGFLIILMISGRHLAQTDSNFTLISQWEVDSDSVEEFQTDRGFLSSNQIFFLFDDYRPFMVAVDINDPENPKQLLETKMIDFDYDQEDRLNISQIYEKDNFLFVVYSFSRSHPREDCLRVLDISDPENIHISFATELFRSTEIWDDFLITYSDSESNIYNITDPGNISLYYDVNLSFVHKLNDYYYFRDYPWSIYLIMDFSDLNQPQEIGQIAFQEYLNCVCYQDRFFYSKIETRIDSSFNIINNSTLYQVDNSDPLNPMVIDSINIEKSFFPQVVHNDHLFCIEEENRDQWILHSYDLTSTDEFIKAGSCSFDDYYLSGEKKAYGNYLFFYYDIIGLSLIDISDCSQPHRVLNLDIGQARKSYYVDEDFLYTTGLFDLRSYDISDPLSITETGITGNIPPYELLVGITQDRYLVRKTLDGFSILKNDLIEESSDTTTIDREEEPSPVKFLLQQNYPNPFNPKTMIEYQLPQAGHVSLKVYNMLGEVVAILVNKKQPAGKHSAEFDGRSLSSGIYFYRIETNGKSECNKMVLMK